MTPRFSSLSAPRPKPLKRSAPICPALLPAEPHLVQHFLLLRLCTRAGVVSSGWKVKARAFSQLLPEAPASRKRWGGSGPPGRLSGHSGGSELSGLPRSPWAKRRDRADFKSRSWCRTLGRGGGRARIQRWAQSWPGGTLAGTAGSGADQAGWSGLRSAGARRRRFRLSPGQPGSGQGPPAATGAQSPRAAGGGRAAPPGGGPRSLARPPERASGRPASARAAAGPGRGRRGPAQEVPPASASCPPPAARAPPRPGPRRRRSRQPQARWA